MMHCEVFDYWNAEVCNVIFLVHTAEFVWFELGYMFMNKISMSQTFLYNFLYEKLPDFYNNQSLWKAFGYILA